MRKIEPAKTSDHKGLTRQVQDFWTRNVNAERVQGEVVAVSPRGEDSYFAELEQQRYRSHRHLLPWVTSMQPGRSVLEIGCGVGLDSFVIANNGLDLTAVDLTKVAVETAQGRFHRKGIAGRFSLSDACNLPFGDDVFDYVYSFGVLHHVANTPRSLGEALRVLKPGGEALIMLYNRRSLNELAHRLSRIPFEERDELCPVVRRFSIAEVRGMLKDFSRTDIHLDYIFGEGYGPVFRWTPRWLYDFLSKYWGWHIMIRATK